MKGRIRRTVTALVSLGLAAGAFAGADPAGLEDGGLRDPESVRKVETSDPWYDVYDLGAGVRAIHEPGHRERVLSYLILGETKALLFDTGTGISDIHAVVSELTDLDVVVLNSHSHPDHVGGNHQFDTIYAIDTEYGRSKAAGMTVEESRRFVLEQAFSRTPPPSFSRDTYRIHPYEIDRFVEDGERIGLGGRQLEVVATPGHSPDSLCLVDRQHRFLLTGDTFYLGRLFVTELDKYAVSAKRMAGLESAVDRLLPGHSATLLQADFLAQMHDAFRDLARRRRPERESSFGAFSIVLPDSSR